MVSEPRRSHWVGTVANQMGVMAVTRTKMEEFRRLAQECRATALTLSTEQARAEMLAMADVCDRVAAQPTNGTDVSEAGAVVRLMTRSN
jgi:pyruvate-formate lyase